MIKFLKESIQEFEHVVWPTKNETRKYFSVVVTLIVALTIFIFLISTIFSTWLWFAKDAINPSKITPTNTATEKNIEDALKFLSWSTEQTWGTSQNWAQQ